MRTLISKYHPLAVIILALSIYALPVACASTESSFVTRLSIEPNKQTVFPGDEFIIEVVVEQKEQVINAGEITVFLETNVAQLIGIRPGIFFGEEPLIGYSQTDNLGNISYALARNGQVPSRLQKGVFAILQFQVLDNVTPGTYEVELKKVGLADNKFKEIENVDIHSGLLIVE